MGRVRLWVFDMFAQFNQFAQPPRRTLADMKNFSEHENLNSKSCVLIHSPWS